MKSIIPLVFCFLLSGCQDFGTDTNGKTESDSVNSVAEDNYILQKLDSCPETKLPFTYEACNPKLEGQLPGIVNGTHGEFEAVMYAKFKGNGDYVALITLTPADCILPAITTYNANGEQIDQQYLAIGQCGFDCGFTCIERLLIDKDYSIYVVDSIVHTPCDDNYGEMKDSTRRYVIEIFGKFNNDGSITLSERQEKDL